MTSECGLHLRAFVDTYSAEKQMTRSLPKMARAAADEQLAQATEAEPRHLGLSWGNGAPEL